MGGGVPIYFETPENIYVGLRSRVGPLSRANSQIEGQFHTDRAIPQRGPISRSAENTFPIRQVTWD